MAGGSFVLTVLMALNVRGAPVTDASSSSAVALKAKAQAEIQQVSLPPKTEQPKTRREANAPPPVAAVKVTDAQVSGAMLSLKDPMPAVRGRSWDYFLRFTLQSFQPRGSGGNDLAETRFPIDDVAPTVMPAVRLGFALPVLTQTLVHLKIGFGGEVGFSSEKGSAHFATGYTEPDVHLNSTLYSADPFLGMAWARLPKLTLNLGSELGGVNETQSSSNKLAEYSEHSQYFGWALGLEYAFTSRFSILSEYVHRKTLGDSQARLQNENFELGTRLAW